MIYIKNITKKTHVKVYDVNSRTRRVSTKVTASKTTKYEARREQ